MLSTGDPMLRVSLVEGKPTVTKQSYVDYIKDTHTFPVSSTGELLRPLNKAVFPDTEDFIKKSVSLIPGVQSEPEPIAPKPVEVKPVVPVVDSNSETLYTASHKDIIEYTENSPVAQSLGLHSLFKQGGMFYDKVAYEQALQSINDNPNVVYQVVVREVKEGKGIKAKQVPYSPNIEGDFILAIIPTDKAGIPVILLRKDDAELAGIDLSQSPMSITGTSAENFVSQSTQEKPVAPVPPPVEQVSPIQAIINKVNSEGAGEMFDEEEAKEAQKAKEDCINPAKQVRDQIKKKPKL